MFSPFIFLALAFASGIGAGDFFCAALSGCLGWLTAGVAATAAAALLAARHGRRRLFPVLLFLSAFLSGMAHLLADTDSLSDTFPDREQLYCATLRQVFKTRETQRTLDVVLADGRVVRLYDASACTPLHAGDTLVFKARITQPRPADFTESFDYGLYLRRHHIAGTAYTRHLAVVGRARGFSLKGLRERLVGELSGQFEGPVFQILAAITLGSRATMQEDVQEAFRMAGASHALALSGLHLGILFMLFETFVARCRPGRRLQVALGLVGLTFVWLFVALTGAPPSLQRAALMYTLYKAARLLRRDAEAPVCLATAAVVILIADAQALFDVGFQLSFASVAGILWFVPRWSLHHKPAAGRTGRWAWRAADMVWNLACVSLAASLATLPLAAWHFHSVPMYGVFANLFVVPTLYVLLTLSLLFFLLPPLHFFLVPLLSAATSALLGGLQGISALPCATLNFAPGPLFVPAFYLTVAALTFRKYLWAALPFGLALAACLPQPMPPQIIVYDAATPLVHCIVDRSRSFLWTPGQDGRTSAAIDRISRGYWLPAGMMPPATAANATAWAQVRGGVLCFGSKRVAVVGVDGLSAPPAGSKVDVLLVAGRTAERPERLLARLRPQTAVVTRRMAGKGLRMWQQAAAESGTPLHDLRRQGAFRLYVK